MVNVLTNQMQDPQRKEELTRPTNPVAQKSLLVSHMKTTSLKTTPKSFSPSTKVHYVFNSIFHLFISYINFLYDF